MGTAGGSPGASMNWKEIDLVLAELDLPGLFVREISQPDEHDLVLDLAGRGRSLRLLVHLAPPLVRLHATARAPAGPPETAQSRSSHGARRTPRRFAAFLRAHIKGGHILRATQAGRERIVRLEIHRGDADTLLWIRLWSNAANVLLTDPGGRILDAFYRRPRRGEITGGTFAPPAPGGQGREYSIRELAGEGSFNERLDRLARAADEARASTDATARALRALSSEEERLARRAETLERQLEENAGYERLKEQGDLILASLGSAARGDRWLELEDRRIELDRTLTPSENAQAYFARYKRARAAATRLQAEITAGREALSRVRAYLARVYGSAAAAPAGDGAPPSPDPLALEEALRDLGLRAEAATRREPPARAAKVKAPGLHLHSGPFSILVGRTAAENDEILRRHVRGNDTWFHCRDYPGAYVFVRSIPGKTIPLEVMLDAANLAIHYSKAKASGVADVYYTAVKYLRKPRDGKLGLVVPTLEKNLRVRLEPARIGRLKGAE